MYRYLCKRKLVILKIPVRMKKKADTNGLDDLQKSDINTRY